MSAYRNEIYFAKVPEWVLFSEVGAVAVRLYAVLNRAADDRSDNTEPFRRKKLAEKVGVSVDTVDRARRELDRIAAIETIERFDAETGDQIPNAYLVRQAPPPACETHASYKHGCDECREVRTIDCIERGREMQRGVGTSAQGGQDESQETKYAAPPMHTRPGGSRDLPQGPSAPVPSQTNRAIPTEKNYSVGATAVAPAESDTAKTSSNEQVHEGDVADVTVTPDGQLQVLVAGDVTPDKVLTVANVNKIVGQILSGGKRPPDRWIQILGREVKRLRDEGIDSDVIVEAGKRMRSKGLPPSTIDGFVIEVDNNQVSKQRSAEASLAIENCDLCDSSGFLLADDGAPIEPIVKCMHKGGLKEGVA